MLLLVDSKRTVRESVGERPLLPAIRDLVLLIEQGLVTITDPPQRPQPTVIPREAPHVSTPEVLGACPRLGFADDPTRHYSRPTALHRCFATDIPGLISSQEQRGLCLGGRYATCPRFVASADTPPPLAAT